MTEQEDKPITRCPIHDIADIVCGGPHKEVFTDLGWEVMKEDQEPIGVILIPGPEEEKQRWSLRSKN